MEKKVAKDFLNYELKDNNTEFGGISFVGETLKDFINESDLSENTPMELVNKALIECGIQPIKI